MSDDLETALRAALRDRAADITPESLRHSSVPTPRGPSRTRVLVTASVTTVAIVAAVGVAADRGVWSWNHAPTGLAGSPGNTSSVLSPSGVVGLGKIGDVPGSDALDRTRWKLSTIGHGGQLSRIASTLDTSMQFLDGWVSMSDTVNSTSGRYFRTSSGFIFSDGMTTAVGYVGTDPDVLRVLDAVHAVTHGTSPAVEVDARVVGNSLVVSAEGFVLTYVRDGEARAYATPEATGAPSTALSPEPTVPSGATGNLAPADPLDGSRWKLLTVDHDGHVTRVPSNLDTSLEFSDGHASMSDTVNGISGRYIRSATGFTIPQAGSTYVGFISQDPERNLVITAIRAMTPNTPNATADVRARLHGEGLVITVGGYVLTYIRDGVSRTVWPPVATDTPSPTLTPGPALSPGATTSPGNS